MLISCNLINLQSASEFLPRKGYVFVKKVVNLKKCLGDSCTTGRYTAVGSGFIVEITNEGSYVMTASHVCKENLAHYFPNTKINIQLQVETLDGREYDAELLTHDPNIDACLMFVQNLVANIEEVKISNTPPKEGDKVYNIASPYGIKYKNVVPIFEGRYIGQRGDQAFYTFDAAPGSSGSMILNDRGQLIGLLHSVFVKMNVITVSVAYNDLITFIHNGIRQHRAEKNQTYERILLFDDKTKL
jgi:S1-C subfamily serine protease